MSGFPPLKAMGIDEAALTWNLTPSHVRELCENGKVKAIKIGDTWLIKKDQPNPNKQ